MINRVNETLANPISAKLSDFIMVFQYTDDIIAHDDLTTMVTLKLVLWLFSRVSGLHINFDKSSFCSINLTQFQCWMVASVIGCAQTRIPVSYLGMPLSIKAPCRPEFLPLIEKIESKVEGWRGKLLSKGAGCS